MPDQPAITVQPLTPERWPDLEQVFGPNGATSGCWCMWFRQTNDEYSRQHGEQNRLALKALTERGDVPGLIAYIAGEPAAWCAVQPRDAYPRLRRSRTTKPLDDQPAWAVVCFFTHRRFRGLGLQPVLLKAAVDYARDHGAKLVEGYPYDATGRRVDAASGYYGFLSTFLASGFREVARRSKVRPIVRRFLQ